MWCRAQGCEVGSPPSVSTNAPVLRREKGQECRVSFDKSSTVSHPILHGALLKYAA